MEIEFDIKKILLTLGTLVVLMGGVITGLLWAGRVPVALSSVRAGDEYYATSTAPNNVYGATIVGDQLIRTGAGSLGSVTITGAGTAAWSIYDATTTDVTARTGQKATSTILLVNFPASAAAGTYVFDATYNTGLLLEVHSGDVPTSTILYR